MHPQHSEHEPAERPEDVPQAQADDPCRVEKAGLDWILHAKQHAAFVADGGATRANALVRTKLEEAEMWARRDLELKSAKPEE